MTRNPANEGDDVTFESLETENVNNELYADQFSGADLGEQINNAIAEFNKRGVHITVRKEGTISTPVDVTDARDVVVDFAGGRYRLETTGQPAIDLTDSFNSYVDLRGAVLWGDQNNMPSSGILSGYAGTTNQWELDDPDTGVDRGPEMRYIIGGQVYGFFEYAAVWAQAKERQRYTADFGNINDQGHAFVLTANNRARIGGGTVSETSPYKTLQNGPPSKQWFHGCSFFEKLQLGDGLLYIEGTHSCLFSGIDFQSVGSKFVTFDVSQNPIDSITFDTINVFLGGDVSSSESAPFAVIRDETSGNNVNDLYLRAFDGGLAGTNGSAEPLITTASSSSGSAVVDSQIGPGISRINDCTGLDLPGSAQRSTLVNTNVAQTLSVVASVTCKDATLSNGIETANSGVRIHGEGRAEIATGGENCINIRSNDADVRNWILKQTSGGSSAALHVGNGDTGTYLEGIDIRGSSQRGAFIEGSDTIINGLRVRNVTNVDLGIKASNCVVTGLILDGDFEVFNGSDNWVYGRIAGTVSDAGTRTVINGRSQQSATPGSGNTGDEWGGNETLANELGVVVEDTSVTAPYDLYRADSAGNWVQIG